MEVPQLITRVIGNFKVMDLWVSISQTGYVLVVSYCMLFCFNNSLFCAFAIHVLTKIVMHLVS